MNALPLAGRVALVTGANTGIGRVTATQLALHGAHVFLACRSEERTLPVLADVAGQSGGAARAEFLPLELGDLASVRRCAQQFLARGLPLQLLVNNAGAAGRGLDRLRLRAGLRCLPRRPLRAHIAAAGHDEGVGAGADPATSLYCATSPACAAETGLYYDRCRIVSPSRVARDEQLAARLWDASEVWTLA